jgi:hypothetical protein
MPGLTMQQERPAMTTVQGWVIVIEVGIIALAYLIGLFRGPGRVA